MSTTGTSSVTSSDAADAGRAATDPAGPTGRLATWLSATTLTDVPASVRERAKYLLLDGVGCALVGAQLPVSRIGVGVCSRSTRLGRGHWSDGASGPPAPSPRRC